MSNEATIHLMCGPVAAGKTTLARRLAGHLPAVRLSRDEWMIRLYRRPCDDPVYIANLGACTELLWEVALEIVAVGSSVILDWNFWSRERRAEARQRSEAAGFPVHLHWLDMPVDEVVARANARLAAAAADAHRIDEDGVRQFLTIFQPPANDEGPLTRHEQPPEIAGWPTLALRSRRTRRTPATTAYAPIARALGRARNGDLRRAISGAPE